MGLLDRLRSSNPDAQQGPGAQQGYAVPLTDPDQQCKVCGSEDVEGRRITHHKNAARVASIRRCAQCGFVAILRPGAGNYRNLTTTEELPVFSRAGNLEAPGREFYMSRMGLQILGRKNRDVLIYGVGSSQDNHHVAELPRAGTVSIGDIMAVRDDAPFVDLNQPAQRQYDLVIASEVVEHFRNPRPDFSRMFEYVADDGLLVCGTNINDGHPLRRIGYIFFPDHTSYYSPHSLHLVAQAEGWLMDFRPVNATRKRYVMFTRSQEVMAKVALYFATHPVAPSEYDPEARSPKR